MAAIFAIHPLRVESVAWVAERKDVLSGLFFMLTLLAYLGYVRRPFSLVRYLAVMALFALGLMAKPMLVTLPFVLLLLDYWPLGRMDGRAKLPLSLSGGSAGASPSRFSCWGGSCTATPEATVQLSPQQSVKPRPVVAGDGATAGRGFMANGWFLVLEKIPLFVLAAASCVATTVAQGQPVVGLNPVPLSARISNAPVSYVAYLGQFFYPVGLAAIYPHPGPGLPLWKTVGRPLGVDGHFYRGAGMATAAPCCVGRLVLVSGDACAGDRLGPGGIAVHGRPLYVLAADRAVHRAGLGGGPGGCVLAPSPLGVRRQFHLGDGGSDGMCVAPDYLLA